MRCPHIFHGFALNMGRLGGSAFIFPLLKGMPFKKKLKVGLEEGNGGVSF